MEPDATLCFCFHVSKRKVVNFVKQKRPRRASQVSECFGAGTGCGWCIPFLVRIHREVVGGEVVDAPEPSAADWEAQRQGYLSEVRSGARDRNRHADTGAEPAIGPRTPAEKAFADDDDDFDVSSYFSREAPPEPEPDDL